MAGRLSFSVAINLLTENFRRGSNELRNGLRNIQMQAMTMFAALGAGSLGLGELVSNLIEVARQTNRTSTALKNVSGDWETYGKNQKFLIALSQKYGLYVNDLVGNFSKFTAAATNANMSMKDQQLLFESLSRASTGFGLSADETNGVFLAVTQMMGKGKIQAEELRGQLGERMPIAMQAMARAAGTTVAGLDKIMKAGKLMSADVLPKFAKALNEMMPNVNTDNIETSFNRLKNSFKELTDKLNVAGIYKNLLDQTGQGFQWLMNNFKMVGNAIVNIVTSIIIGKAINAIIASYKSLEITTLRFYKKQALMSGVAFDEMAYNANKFRNIATVAFAKVGVALKAAFASFAPMLIISGIIAIYQHFADLAEKQREIKAIWTDFQNGYKNAGKNDSQVRELQKLKEIVDDTTKSLADRKTALEQINTILGTNYEFDKKGLSIAGDINSKIRERLGLLEKQAELSYLVNAKMKAGDALSESNNKISEDEKQVELWTTNSNNKDKKGLWQIGVDKVQKDIWIDKLAVDKQEQKANQAVYNAASNKVISLTTDIEKITGKLKPYSAPVDASDKKEKKTDLQKAEESYYKEKESIINRFNNGQIKTELEKNKLLDELNKKSFEKYAEFSKADLSKSKYYTSIKNGSENPLISKFEKGNEKYNEVQSNYSDSKKDLDVELQLGYINQQEYNTALQSLIKSTIKASYKIDDIEIAGTDFIKGLFTKNNELDKLKPKEKDLSKYDFKSAYENLGKNDVELASINLEDAKKELEDLKDLALKTTDDLTEQLDKKLSNVQGLDKALKLLEVKKQLKELQKELNNGLYDGVKNVAGSARNMYEGFKAVSDTISNVDASGFEKFLSIWDALTNTVDSILSVVKTIETLTEVTKKLGLAKQAEQAIDNANTTQKITNAGVSAASALAGSATVAAAATTEVAANTAAAGSGAAASVAAIPIVGPILAIAAVGSVLAMLASSLPKFANGGIVQGGSLSGDKILARVNAGEMILNQGQQSNLFALLNGQASGVNTQPQVIVLDAKVSGSDIFLSQRNYSNKKSKAK